MFIGHFGVGLALKKADKNISLGVLFLAVSFIDLLHYFLTIIGIESVEIVPGFTEWAPLKGTNPLTHGLAGIFAWSLLVFVLVNIYGRLKKDGSINYTRAAVILSLGAFSHFICDVIVHAPDLPVLGWESRKLGLGLWNYPLVSNSLEIGIYMSGLLIYYKSTKGESFAGKYGMLIFSAGIIAFHLLPGLVPPMDSVNTIYINLLTASIIIIGIAEWLDRKRIL